MAEGDTAAVVPPTILAPPIGQGRELVGRMGKTTRQPGRDAIALNGCCVEWRGSSTPIPEWNGNVVRDPYLTRYSGQDTIARSERFAFDAPDTVGGNRLLPLSYYEPIPAGKTTREVAEEQVRRMGLDPERNLTRAGAGGFSDAYFVHPAPSPELMEAWKAEAVREGNPRLAWEREEAWTRSQASEVIKIRKPKAGPTEAARALMRDFAMQDVAVELASRATYDGTPLIRVLRWNSTVEEVSRGIIRQEVVRGPTAKELEKAASVVRVHSSRAYLSQADQTALDASVKLLRESGLSADEAMDRVAAVEEFYRRAHAPATGFASENWLPLYGNAAQNGQVTSVGLDYNHGANVAWDSKQRIWVMFDW